MNEKISGLIIAWKQEISIAETIKKTMQDSNNYTGVALMKERISIFKSIIGQVEEVFEVAK